MANFGFTEYWGPLPNNNPYEDRFTRTIYASQLFFDSLESKNYVAGASGFRIDVDGTAEFASGVTLGPGAVTIAADLQSQNFVQASNPGVSGDGTGWKIDYDADTAYFGTTYIDGSLGVGGNITTAGTITANGNVETNGTLQADGSITTNGNITANGTITGNDDWTMNNLLDFSGNGSMQTDNSVPYVKIWEPGGVGGRIEFVRSLSDSSSPQIYADDNLLIIDGRLTSGTENNDITIYKSGHSISDRIVIRAFESVAPFTNSTIILNKHTSSTPAIEINTSADSARIGSGVGAVTIDNGTKDGSVLNVKGKAGSGEYYTRWYNNGSAFMGINNNEQTEVSAQNSVSTPGLAFYADPDTGIYRYGDDEIGFAAGGNNRLTITSDGLMFENNDRSVNYRANFTNSDGSPGSSATWTTLGTNKTAWDHNGTNRAIRLTVTHNCFAENSAASKILMATRIRHSFDGGATWNTAGEQHAYAGAAAGGAERIPIVKTIVFNGTATGDVLIQYQAYRSGTITGNFRNISIATDVQGLI